MKKCQKMKVNNFKFWNKQNATPAETTEKLELKLNM